MSATRREDPRWVPGPPEPALPAGEVHVWRIALDRAAADAAELPSSLDPRERQRAATLGHPGRRATFVAARVALRSILARYLGVDPATVPLGAAAGGKPEIEGTGDIRFNLSHSGALALCAVARARAVGVDVERVRRKFDEQRIVERFFTAGERAALLALPPALRSEAFFRCWTRKEAYLKGCGESVFGAPRVEVSVAPGEPPRLLGVSGRPGEHLRFSLRDLAPRAGYVGTLSAEGDGFDLRRFAWAPRPAARASRRRGSSGS